MDTGAGVCLTRSQGLPEVTEPVFHGAFEVAITVSGSTRQQTPGTGGTQGVVHAPGKGLIVQPLAVAAAQHGKPQVRPLRFVQPATVHVSDPVHPATRSLPVAWARTDAVVSSIP